MYKLPERRGEEVRKHSFLHEVFPNDVYAYYADDGNDIIYRSH